VFRKLRWLTVCSLDLCFAQFVLVYLVGLGLSPAVA